VLHFAFKYGGDLEGALLANANAGGETVHRGILLGALLGAAHGASRIPKVLKQGLVGSPGIALEINKFVDVVCNFQDQNSSNGKRNGLSSSKRSDAKEGITSVAQEASERPISSTASMPHVTVPLPLVSMLVSAEQTTVSYALPDTDDEAPMEPPPARKVTLFRPATMRL